MKKVFVPVDFSGPSKNALEYAMALAEVTESNIVLFNAVHVPTSSAGMFVSAMDKIKDEALEQLDKWAEDCRNQLKSNNLENIEISTTTCEGLAVDKIVQYAKEEGADLIIMGTQGSSGVEEVFLGSNTSNVIGKAPCPVLAIPEGVQFKGLDKIVYASEWINADDIILKQLAAFAQAFEAQIDVLHVVTEDEKYDPVIVDRIKSDFLESIDYPNIAFSIQRAISIMDGLDRYLQNSQADMVAMLTQKRTFLDRIFHRSLTKKLAMHTHTPLLAFKE